MPGCDNCPLDICISDIPVSPHTLISASAVFPPYFSVIFFVLVVNTPGSTLYPFTSCSLPSFSTAITFS